MPIASQHGISCLRSLALALKVRFNRDG